MSDYPTFVHLNRDQLRALAHPLRLRLLAALRLDGPSTATALADRLGTNTGKTSYHLRILAKVDLVVEEPERGNARDRWWKAAHDVSSWKPSDFANDPDAAAAANWLLGHVARIYAERVQRWLAVRADWSAEWQAASEMSDLRLRLRPERLRDLNDDLMAVVDRYLGQQDSADDSDAIQCTVLINSFPEPNPDPTL